MNNKTQKNKYKNDLYQTTTKMGRFFSANTKKKLMLTHIRTHA